MKKLKLTFKKDFKNIIEKCLSIYNGTMYFKLWNDGLSPIGAKSYHNKGLCA